jgi:hypothetical protein
MQAQALPAHSFNPQNSFILRNSKVESIFVRDSGGFWAIRSRKS